MWHRLLFLLFLWSSTTMSVAAIAGDKNDNALQAIQGSWLQMYSNRYVQTTSEIDYHCVRAEVSPVLSTSNSTVPTVSLTKKAYQHGNPLLPVEWTQTYSMTFQKENEKSLQDNLLLQPASKTSSAVVVPLWLRRVSPTFLLWSGLDNKTMLVWSRWSLDPVDTVLILQELVQLDFNDTYKSPVASYSLACL